MPTLPPVQLEAPAFRPPEAAGHRDHAAAPSEGESFADSLRRAERNTPEIRESSKPAGDSAPQQTNDAAPQPREQSSQSSEADAAPAPKTDQHDVDSAPSDETTTDTVTAADNPAQASARSAQELPAQVNQAPVLTRIAAPVIAAPEIPQPATSAVMKEVPAASPVDHAVAAGEDASDQKAAVAEPAAPQASHMRAVDQTLVHQKAAAPPAPQAANHDALAPAQNVEQAPRQQLRPIEESKPVVQQPQSTRPEHPAFTVAPSTESAAPAVVRAAHVEAAVQVENSTGMAPTIDVSARANSGQRQANLNHGGDGAALGGGGSDFTSLTQPPEGDDHTSRGIVRGLTALLNHRGGAMTMRLDPPELGSMKVQMNLNQGVVSATFQVGTESARQLLERNIAVLRHALESHGLTVDRLSVQSLPPSTGSAWREGGSGSGSAGGDTSQHSMQGDRDAAGHESRGRGEGFRDSEAWRSRARTAWSRTAREFELVGSGS